MANLKVRLAVNCLAEAEKNNFVADVARNGSPEAENSIQFAQRASLVGTQYSSKK